MYKITSFITNSSLEKIRMLKNTSCSIWVDEPRLPKKKDSINFSMGLNLRVKNENEEYIIKSVPEIKEDGEETPRLVAFFQDNNICTAREWGNVINHKVIKTISIIKDHMIWENEDNLWDRRIDVGIKMISKDNFTFIIMSTFSGVGLFKIWYADYLFDVKKKGEEILEHWGIGFRNVEEFIRLERLEKELL